MKTLDSLERRSTVKVERKLSNMSVWQADFYRRPLQDEAGNSLWELVVCDRTQAFTAHAFCPQAQAKSSWIADQLSQFAGSPDQLPKKIQAFRPQAVNLLEAACQTLGITLEPTRRTPALKQLLQERAEQYKHLDFYTGQPYEPVKLELPPPVPMPENLWGEQWRFGAIAAGDLVPAFQDKPIPILDMPDALLPVELQIASTTPIPGVVIYGGRRSMQLARWLQQARPVGLKYIPGDPDGLILEAGLVDRWVIATFEDEGAIASAKTFQQRQQASQGLHFLWVQPDDSGITSTGFWLLQTLEMT